MGKDKRAAVTPSEISPTSANGSNVQRSSERAALALAIQVRDAAAAEDDKLKQARQRAKADAFLAHRAVEAAETALSRAQETSRFALADAYIEGEAEDRSAVTEAEAALAVAQRRAAELALIEQDLKARSGPAPGHSVPNMRVEEAVRAVVRAHPAVRRLAEDYHIAERAFHTYSATLIWLAARGMIPADLTHAAPSANATRYAEPDDAWTAALENLRIDPQAALPEWDETEPNPYARLPS
jgi:hypothetical protein